MIPIAEEVTGEAVFGWFTKTAINRLFLVSQRRAKGTEITR